MSLDTLKSMLPEYARDIRLNLSSVLGSEQENLSSRQVKTIAVACAHALKSPTLTAGIEAFAADEIGEDGLYGARLAAAIMGMNNIYYRFLHLASNEEYKKMPAKLRMNSMAEPKIDKNDFELAALAVSAINGCGMCVDSHERKLKKENVGTGAIQDAVRIASVLHAVAQISLSAAGGASAQAKAA